MDRLAIERGLEFLARRSVSSGAVDCKYPVAVTGLAGLAFLGGGNRHCPSQRYFEVLDGHRRYLLGRQSARNGYIREGESDDKGDSRMHGHCFAVLFLTQLYGELSASLPEQKKVALAIRRGVDCILKAQSNRGGWTYYPRNPQNDDEASVTITALQALRAADDSGFRVPKIYIDAAIDYVKKCQNQQGAFRYSIERNDPRSSFALTAAAVATLNAAGVYRDSPELDQGFKHLKDRFAASGWRPERAVEDPQFFSYAAFYASQAFYQRGGEDWMKWYRAIRQRLLDKQAADGSWDDDYGPELGTAMAVLVLEIPIQYLPIFER